MKLVRKLRRFSTTEPRVDISLKDLEHHMMSHMTQALTGKPWEEFWLQAREFVWSSGKACAKLQHALPVMIQHANVSNQTNHFCVKSRYFYILSRCIFIQILSLLLFKSSQYHIVSDYLQEFYFFKLQQRHWNCCICV